MAEQKMLLFDSLSISKEVLTLFILTSVAVQLNLSGFSLFSSSMIEPGSHGGREKW